MDRRYQISETCKRESHEVLVIHVFEGIKDKWGFSMRASMDISK